MLKPHSSQLQKRIERHRAFDAGSQPGNLLFYVEPALRCPQLVRFLCARLHETGAEAFLKPRTLKAAIQEYIAQLRGSLDRFYAVDDDSVPCASVYWGIGGITAAMIGGDPIFDGATSWLEPNLSWPEVDRLSFDPDNRWIRFVLDLNRALWECWEEDFAVLPFLHRSPLDAANGIRGTELFLDMFEAPERVTALADHPGLRETILAASLQCPIAGWVTQDRLEQVLDIVRHGRFILALRAPENVDVVACVTRAKQQSNLG